MVLFLSPVGCLLAARFIRDATPAPRSAVPLVLFLTSIDIDAIRMVFSIRAVHLPLYPYRRRCEAVARLRSTMQVR
jgi:hypothetical protein